MRLVIFCVAVCEWWTREHDGYLLDLFSRSWSTMPAEYIFHVEMNHVVRLFPKPLALVQYLQGKRILEGKLPMIKVRYSSRLPQGLSLQWYMNVWFKVFPTWFSIGLRNVLPICTSADRTILSRLAEVNGYIYSIWSVGLAWRLSESWVPEI